VQLVVTQISMLKRQSVGICWTVFYFVKHSIKRCEDSKPGAIINVRFVRDI